jgi:hypothetical protein
MLNGLVTATLEHAKYRVNMQNILPEPFGTSMGLRQGAVLASILFNITLDMAVTDLGTETKDITKQS